MSLVHRRDAYPEEISGGEQQRVAIARAVIARPKILYADEPTGNVDDRIAARIMHLYEELNKSGTTVVIATHNESMVEASGYPIMKLQNGLLELISPMNNSVVSIPNIQNLSKIATDEFS